MEVLLGMASSTVHNVMHFCCTTSRGLPRYARLVDKWNTALGCCQCYAYLSALDWHGLPQQLAARPEHNHIVAVLKHCGHGPVALPHPLLEGHLLGATDGVLLDSEQKCMFAG